MFGQRDMTLTCSRNFKNRKSYGASVGGGETNAKLFFLMVMIINLAVRCLPYEKGENWIGGKRQ